MSTSDLASATAGTAGAAGGAILAVMGIPLGVLAAALIGAGLSYVTRAREPDEVIPVRLIGILADALIGGWLAVALVHLTVLQRYGISAIPLEAIAGLLAISWRVLRLWIPPKADQAFNAFLAFWTRRRDGGAP